jgi:hypothetical protein
MVRNSEPSRQIVFAKSSEDEPGSFRRDVHPTATASLGPALRELAASSPSAASGQ